MNRVRLSLVVCCAALLACSGAGKSQQPGAPSAGQTPDNEAATVNRIIDDALSKPRAYDRLVQLCDGFGHRLSGSKSLEAAIDWAVATMKREGFANAQREPAQVPQWVRGEESATLVEPVLPGKKQVNLAMLGLGMSVGTPADGITAPVVVVKDEAGLQAVKADVKGKIVLFNNPMPKWTKAHGTHYGKTVKYRVHGPDMAAKLGAVAVLVRSVTAHSLRTPHTGTTVYSGTQTKIPAAAVTTEAADLLQRLQDAGKHPVVRLSMQARNDGMVESANAVAELRGRELPDEVVIVSGHIDSWDVGQGAHDDAAGVVMAMETLAILKRLGLRPRRTIRFVAWTNEENGMAGAKAYVERHGKNLTKHAAAIEADFGGFDPDAFGIQMTDKAKEKIAAEQVRGWTKLMARLGTIEVHVGHSSSDISRLVKKGVPGIGLQTHSERYFDYHHTAADTVDKVDPMELSRSTAAMAAIAWLIADMPGRLGEDAAATAR